MYNCVCYMYSLPPYSYIIHIYMYVCVQLHVVAFAVSACVTAHHRPVHKLFNPILGETCEWIRKDKGFWFVAEQVRVCADVSWL